MKIKHIKAYMLALSALFLSVQVHSQGIIIQSGGKIESTGSTSIQIENGNFSNSGTFSPGTGSVIFTGTTLQSITSGGCTFNNVVFDNQQAANADVVVTDPMQINGTATFTNGIVYFSGTGSLSFGSSAISTSGNANSFVDGVVSKTGTDAFTFPTGDVKSGTAIWAPLAIAAPSASSLISAAYYKSAPSYYDDPAYFCDADAFDYVSSTEYWTLSTTNATPDVTLFWADGTRSGIQNLSDLRVASWEDCSGNKWVDKGGSTAGTVASGSITTTVPMTSYNILSLASQTGQNALPVTLVDFSARNSGNITDVCWSTASEFNNASFTVERSPDAIEWTCLTKVPGAGNSNDLINYNFKDIKPIEGITYYRLIQTDFDGGSQVFGPLKVDGGNQETQMSCFPNPFSDQLIVSLQNTQAEQGVLTLTDQTGRVVMHREIGSESPLKEYQLSTADIAEGIYSLEFRAGNFIKSIRIVKE
ncbi:hypothetical protein SDC9_46280 [bioreactor metagenome]|uniref:Secretion system C-terminal sorting domain-containing protein n=1 Tax=bioreactor metagenome TaxID=1076179 RepID=A0A644W973_9ZZZZ